MRVYIYLLLLLSSFLLLAYGQGAEYYYAPPETLPSQPNPSAYVTSEGVYVWDSIRPIAVPADWTIHAKIKDAWVEVDSVVIKMKAQKLNILLLDQRTYCCSSGGAFIPQRQKNNH